MLISAQAESPRGVQTLVVVKKKSCCNADWRSRGWRTGEEPEVEEGGGGSQRLELKRQLTAERSTYFKVLPTTL